MNVAAALLWAKSNWKGLLMAAILASALIWGGSKAIQVSKYRASLERSQTALQDASRALTEAKRAIELQTTIRKADQTAIETRTVYVDRVIQKEAEGRAETDKALEANPAWRDSRVPADVLSSLRTE